MHHGLEARGVIEGRKANGHQVRDHFASGEKGRAALRTEASRGGSPAAASNCVCPEGSRNFCFSDANDDARRKGGAAGQLAVAAMTTEHGDGVAMANVTYRATGAAAGEW